MPRYQTHSSVTRSGFRYHGMIAGSLMVIALAIRFVLPTVMGVDGTEAGLFDERYLLFWMGAKILWLWACTHMALHFGLSAVWGLWGLLFILGPAMILWAVTQKPKWALARARRRAKSGRQRADADGVY